jgi:hypothetical protein
MCRHVKERLDRQGPTGVSWWGRGQCLFDERCGLDVLPGERESDRTSNGCINR